jgi:hypothetical protein
MPVITVSQQPIYGIAPGRNPTKAVNSTSDLFLVKNALAQKWIKRGLGGPDATVPVAGELDLYFDAAGDALYEMVTVDTNCDIYIWSIANPYRANMVGACFLSSAGDGMACTPYDGNTYMWLISGWGYAGTGGSQGTPGATGDSLWIHIEKRGTSFRFQQASANGNNDYTKQVWGAFTGAGTYSFTGDRVGIMRAYNSSAGTFKFGAFYYIPA